MKYPTKIIEKLNEIRSDLNDLDSKSLEIIEFLIDTEIDGIELYEYDSIEKLKDELYQITDTITTIQEKCKWI